MPVDTSTYPTLQPQPNFVQTLGGAAQTIGALNQNKLFNQQYQTNLATSQIYKAAMNPDGSIDQGKLSSLLQSNPNAAYGIGPVLEQSQQIQNQNIANNQAKYNLLKDHLTTLSNYLGPLASGIPTGQKDAQGNPILREPTINDVAGTISHAINTGVATPSEAANFWATLPRDQNGNPDPTQIKPWALQNLQRVQGAAAQYGITNPAPAAVSTGGQTQFIRTPQVGAPSTAATIANTLPPTTPTVATINGQPNTPTVIGPASSQLQVPGQAAPQAQGAPPAAAAPGAAPSTGQPSPASPAQPSGPVQTGLAPGVADAAAAVAHASANQGIALQQMADGVPAQKGAIENLRSTMQSFTPGPGSTWTKNSLALVNRGLQSIGFSGYHPQAVANQEEFTKQAENLAQAQYSSLGGTGTDAQLHSTQHTVPSADFSKLGNEQILNVLEGNADALAAKNKAWQQYQEQHGAQSYGQFSTQWNQFADPRLWQAPYSKDPKERAAIYSGILSGVPKAQRPAFQQFYNSAVSAGLIPDPRQQNGGR